MLDRLHDWTLQDHISELRSLADEARMMHDRSEVARLHALLDDARAERNRRIASGDFKLAPSGRFPTPSPWASLAA